MKKTIFFLAIIAIFTQSIFAQNTSADEISKLQKRVDPYLELTEKTADWLVSRLQMYWYSHATDVFINGETFDHAGGDRAPFPTVKYPGIRGTSSAYNAPKLEDVMPYDDDEASNVTFVNKQTGQMEKAHPSKTGCNISSLNRRILGLARDAAKIYAATGEERYARMALPVFDTYMKGIYYRNVPIDLNHGHQQTLVGMTTFEVIHEDAINELTETYRLLNNYIKKDRDIYDGALRKWAENIIANGVPHNNWNLLQAEFLVRIALVLQDDEKYADNHGKQYYIDYVVNKSSIRQWSMKKMAERCFSPEGVWYESPGYSTMVVGDFIAFANSLDRDAGVDLFNEIPVLQKAVEFLPQYLMPNRMIAGFGDTHPNYINTKAINSLREYAVRHEDTALLEKCDRLLSAVRPDAPVAEIEALVSPMLYAPNVSWIANRTGMNAHHDLMFSLNGSLGNHQHANGISLELYGKGFVLGPDAGIGKHLYGGLDYAEYYSQFPAHNTVCVNGISSYPVMMSNHAFKVLEQKEEFACVEFTEPEANALQQRTVGLVKTSDKGGYYIDIFRSKMNEPSEGEFHDYFYHNIGQQMTLSTIDDKDLQLRPTDELAFAGGCLYAYSYIYDKLSAETSTDVKAIYNTKCYDGRSIDMTMWMKGNDQRTIFKALSPVNLEYERLPNEPYDIDKQPVLTFVARQNGEAWNNPFVAVFEPSDNEEPSEILRVSFFKPESKDQSAQGVCVEMKNGCKDYIFSSATGAAMKYNGMKAKGYLVIIKK